MSYLPHSGVERYLFLMVSRSSRCARVRASHEAKALAFSSAVKALIQKHSERLRALSVHKKCALLDDLNGLLAISAWKPTQVGTLEQAAALLPRTISRTQLLLRKSAPFATAPTDSKPNLQQASSIQTLIPTPSEISGYSPGKGTRPKQAEKRTEVEPHTGEEKVPPIPGRERADRAESPRDSPEARAPPEPSKAAQPHPRLLADLPPSTSPPVSPGILPRGLPLVRVAPPVGRDDPEVECSEPISLELTVLAPPESSGLSGAPGSLPPVSPAGRSTEAPHNVDQSLNPYAVFKVDQAPPFSFNARAAEFVPDKKEPAAEDGRALDTKPGDGGENETAGGAAFSATGEVIGEHTPSVQVCSSCGMCLARSEFAPGEVTCLGCQEDMAVEAQAIEEFHARALEERRKVVPRVLADPRGKIPKKLRLATLQELTSTDRQALAAQAVEEWGPDFVSYTATSGSRYRVELREGPYRQVNLANGTVRCVYREPPPLPPGLDEVSWKAMTAPGATWRYEAAYRDSEVLDSVRFPSPKALSDASMKVSLPAAISAALEALRQAQMRAEIPEHDRF